MFRLRVSVTTGGSLAMVFLLLGPFEVVRRAVAEAEGGRPVPLRVVTHTRPDRRVEACGRAGQNDMANDVEVGPAAVGHSTTDLHMDIAAVGVVADGQDEGAGR